MPADIPASRGPSRVRLYLPFILLALLVIGWSAAWFVVRAKTMSGLDEWLAAEAASGRQWTCTDRSVAGYPFRIELSCAGLRFARPDVTATLGRTVAVMQVYRPGHMIIESEGPLRVAGRAANVDSSWRLLQASVILKDGGLERLALVANDPTIRAAEPGAAPIEIKAAAFEAHARPDPADPATVDLAFSGTRAVLPGLDALVGGTEAADIDLVLRLSRTFDLPARPVVSELERWRLAGGRLEIDRARLLKGQRQIEAKGSASLDESHRPQGRLEGQVAGIEGLLGQFVGDRAGLASSLLGALLGGQPAQQARPSDPSGPRMKPIPPLRVERGRLFVGPLQIPGVGVPPLY